MEFQDCFGLSSRRLAGRTVRNPVRHPWALPRVTGFPAGTLISLALDSTPTPAGSGFEPAFHQILRSDHESMLSGLPPVASPSIMHTRQHQAVKPTRLHTMRMAATISAGPGDASYSSGAGVVSFHTTSPPSSAQHTSGAPSTPASSTRGCSGSTSFRASGFANFRSRSVETSKDGNRTLQQLQALGLAGVVSYGLLNTLYYTCTFLFVWTYVSKVPSGEGLAAAARSFLTVFATVWAGSQVTKLARAGGAVLMAPFVDKVLDWLQAKMRYQSKQQAFLLVLGTCLGLALGLFGVVLVSWA